MTDTSVLGAMLALEHADADAAVVMEKRLGIWVKSTRSEVLDRVAVVAHRLADLAVSSGDVVLLAAADHADWLVLDLALQAVGAIVAPVPPRGTPEDLRHALAVTAARMVVVDDPERADVVLEVAEHAGIDVGRVVDVDPGGLHGHQDPRLVALSTEVGDADVAGARTALADRVSELTRDRPAVRLLTGGGRAVQLSHGAVLAGGRAVASATDLGPSDRVLSYRPLADPTERTTTIAASLVSGALLVLPESRDQVVDATYEVAPTYIHLTRRWVDRTASEVVDRLQGGSGIKGLLGRRWVRQITADRSPTGRGLAVRYPVMEKLGLDGARVVVVTGSPLGASERAFTRALGLPVRAGYAIAEAGGLVTLGSDDDLGTALDHAELHVDGAGQVLVTGPAVDGATVETGDRGALEDGRLVLGGRLDDQATIAGTNVDLAAVEAAMRQSPYVREAVLDLEGERAVVVVELAPEPVERWATRQRITFATFRALTVTDEVQDLVRSELEAAAARAGLPTIDEIRVLPTSLEQVRGALTTSGRVRRDVVVASSIPGASAVDAGVA